MSGEMAAGYNPTAVESAWYSWWEASGFFKPAYKEGTEDTPRDEGVFVIPQPPPNVTGSLHLGHALGAALQDALSRWYRTFLGATILY